MRLRILCLLFATLPFGARASAASALDPDPLDLKVRPDPSQPPLTAAEQRARDQALARMPKGPLPDPSLLDGSKQAEEKKQDYGMLGEFEIPGSDEKSDKVGGPPDQKQGGGAKQPDDKSQKSSGSQAQASQQQGGGAADKADQSQNGGGAGSESADGSQSGGGSSGSKSSSKSSKGGKGGGSANSIAQNDPNATAEGAESSGLSSPEGGETAGQGSAAPPKPGEMKIGDATMQIKTQAASAAPNVVGVQQPAGKEVPQQYGRMAAGQPQTNTNVNKGVEKGQTMPNGL
jgi:hypothetical protein